MIGKEIERRLLALKNDEEAKHLSRFFKTGHGEYGEGDKFLGIRVPVTRSIVKNFRGEGEIDDILYLTGNEYHEIRLAGFLLLIDKYKYSVDKKSIVELYLNLIDRGNNWDLVDVIAPKILGDYLVKHVDERYLLNQLAAMKNKLWHQRVAIVSCHPLICNYDYEDTLAISELYLTHKHDLIHKATGWMLRETGKHGGIKELLEFLDLHASIMPRTMLRYAIELFNPELKWHYMSK